MEIAALIVAILACLGFVVAAARPPLATTAIAVGLFLLTLAWILQSTILSGPHPHVGP